MSGFPGVLCDGIGASRRADGSWIGIECDTLETKTLEESPLLDLTGELHVFSGKVTIFKHAREERRG
jgi:hypothetical protein